MRFLDFTIADFLNSCADRQPTPGGGSCSALTGALGVSMLLMAANYTTGEKFKHVQGEVERITRILGAKMVKLEKLIDQDAQVYRQVRVCYQMPKENQEEKIARARAIEHAYKDACAVPLEIMSTSLDGLRAGDELLRVVNPNLVSDVGVGATLLFAAIKGAHLNVLVNLSYIKDTVFVEEKSNESCMMLENGRKLAEKILSEVEGLLR